MELSDTAIEKIMAYRRAWDEWMQCSLDGSDESDLKVETYHTAKTELAMIISLEYGE